MTKESLGTFFCRFFCKKVNMKVVNTLSLWLRLFLSSKSSNLFFKNLFIGSKIRLVVLNKWLVWSFSILCTYYRCYDAASC